MNLSFESGEFNFGSSIEIPQDSQYQETIDIINGWKSSQNTFTISTSGTTGVFKNIVLERKHLLWSATKTKEACGLSNNEKEFCCLPLNKVGGMMQIIRSLIFDRDLKVVSPVADPMVKLDEQHDYTLTSLTPYQFFHILKSEDSLNKLSRFKSVLVGGGPISVELEEDILAFVKWVDTKFYHTYGMTETASHIALRRIISENNIFRFVPFDGVQLSKDKDECLEISIPELGIVVPTHDMVDLNKDGFFFTGRKDNIINSGGLKIIPEPIERKIEESLHAIGAQIPFYIKGVSDTALGQRCVLVVEKKYHKQLPIIQKIIQDNIEPYERPKEYVLMNQFKYTKNNKLIRA